MNAINWFEIPVTDMARAQRFYEALLGKPLRREVMGPSTLAIFPYQEPEGVGGALIQDSSLAGPAAAGTLVYLNMVQDKPLVEVLARVVPAGGQVVMDCTALPEGMGVIAQFLDTEGNQVGLHAMA